MRSLLLLLCLTTLGLAQESSSPALDAARVQISYQELRSLLDAAKPRPLQESPVASAILSAHYELQLEEESLRGRAEYVLQTFRDGPHVVPLAGGELIIARTEPKEAIIILQDGHYAIAVEGKQRLQTVLHFSLPARKTDEGQVFSSAIFPAVSTSLRIDGVPESRQVAVENALRQKTPNGPPLWQLGRSCKLEISVRDQPKPLPAPVTMPAVIRTAQATMRVVPDGAFSNTMTWQIQHQAPMVWTLSLPENLQLVSARINGRPARPSQPGPGTLEFRLPESSQGEVPGQSLVELSYTGRLKAFDPVRGEITLSLPETSLLIENLNWKVAIPAAYETIAAQGNVEFLPGKNRGEIMLGKELCQGEVPSVQLFYQKPASTKKSE